ncbi:MAG: VTT domain-containing protein [Lentisphaeria bacterium]|nr:VTT domain-containing protein [Lentisphaeria bacterium]
MLTGTAALANDGGKHMPRLLEIGQSTFTGDGGSVVTLVTAIALATFFVSEDLTCIVCGLLVARATIPLLPTLTACLVGIWLGDLLLYAVGTLGKRVFARRPLRWWIRPGAIEAGEQWFARRGSLAVFLGRFVPGARLPTYVAAGVLRMAPGRFATYTALACLVWVPLLFMTSILVGSEALALAQGYGRLARFALIPAVIAAWLVARIVPGLLTWRGRRQLLGAWRRWRRWEFWPPWLFYPPVIGWILLLLIRYRGANVFTAVNPAMPAGGFIAERKSDILAALAAAGATPARFAIIPEAADNERVAGVKNFMEEQRLDFPLVLKPERGQRGQGVEIVRSNTALADYLARVPGELVAQEYVAGHEYGVFYIRHPESGQGRVFSVTEKVFPELTGDGTRTLEELILADPRAVCMASHYLKVNRNRLGTVVPMGESVRLVDIGTHCRGAIFLDGGRLVTPGLLDRLDAIGMAYEGFFFGRYDVRAESPEAFSEGRFTILELNGLTSEATHIYDPRHSLGYAYRILFEQWRLAFEIGAANRARGYPVTGLAGLWRLWRSFRRPPEVA